jgi:hypothetical protein
MKTSDKRICHICHKTARIWHKKKWWCSMEAYEGEYNLKGVCPKEKKK